MANNRVVVIEDDRNIAEYFQAVLSMAALEVEVFLTARDGLIRLAGEAPGLILLDMHLGNEIGGEDILYQIRSNPRFDQTRVIVVTGYPNTVQLVENMADLVLIKPVGIDQLTTLAKRMISLDVIPRGLSFRDPVTSLFNLEFFNTRLELAFERAKRRPEFIYALILLQLELCDPETGLTLPQGNTLTSVQVEIARRLKQNLRPTDTIAHVSGMKYVSLYEDLRRNDDLDIILERICRILAVPVKVDGKLYTLNLYYGTAARDLSYRKPSDVFSAASQSLEEALTSKQST